MSRRSRRPRSAFRWLLPVGAAVSGVVAATLPRTAGAQALRLTVRDSSTGAPLPHALVGLSAPDGRSVAHGITDALGTATLVAASGGTFQLRVRRIGQRPYAGPTVTLAADETRQLALAVPRVPVTLDAITVTGAERCGLASAPDVALLWEAARTALATVAAQADAAGALTWPVLVERNLDSRGRVLDEAEAPLPPRTRPFSAVPPDRLARDGYIVGALDGAAAFHAPDERTLLSEEFVRTHCFAPARAAREAQAAGASAAEEWIGVRFTPVPGRPVSDVAGVVWLDRATAEPRRMEYRYVWRRLPRGARELGGSSDFARLPSGAFVVSRWRIRLPRLVEVRGSLQLDGYRESGGELRAARSAP